MRAVNLLPRDLERAGNEGGRAPLLVAAGGIAAVTAAGVVLFMSASGSVSDRQTQLDSVEAAIARVPNTARPAVAAGAIAQERSDRVAALAAALTTRVPLDRLLRELAFVLPEDAWLTGLTASMPQAAATATVPPGTPAAPSTGTQVTIQGATYSHESVARVLARLAAIPSLDDVKLTASARAEPTVAQSGGKAKTKHKTVVTFTIAANLLPAGSSS
jgi:Tfp pilus assembly protein PilN